MNNLLKAIALPVLAGLFFVSCERLADYGETDESGTDVVQPMKQDTKNKAKVTIGADVSEWSSDTDQDAANGIYPIGGAGQLNGEFSIAERNGIQVAMRIQERGQGPYTASGNKTGEYESETGFSSGTRAIWNYDWHVDLRDAIGQYKGTTLSDYNLYLDTDIAESLYGFDVPLNLSSTNNSNGVLYQGSWNPDFGNSTFDPTVADTYFFELSLEPKTFNGPAISIRVEVDVKD